MLLEICAYSLASCATAVRAGAHRVELCDGPEVGGITPVPAVITAAMEMGIPVFPMVRPRGGDFLFNPDEWEELLRTVRLCRGLGCPGIVSGAQHTDGRLDAVRMQRIVDAAGPMAVTCHKVFDGVPDAEEALETLMESGCKRVLTSGLAPDAMFGARKLQSLVARANGRISVMPGGGVRSTNIRELARITGAHEFHSSAITAHPQGAQADEEEVRALLLEMGAQVGQ